MWHPRGHVVPHPLAGEPRLLRIDRAMTLALKPIFTPSYLIEHEVEVGKTGPAKTGPAGPAAPALIACAHWGQ